MSYDPYITLSEVEEDAFDPFDEEEDEDIEDEDDLGEDLYDHADWE